MQEYGFSAKFSDFFGNPPIPYSDCFPKLSSFKRTYTRNTGAGDTGSGLTAQGVRIFTCHFYTNCWRTSSQIGPSTEWAMHRPKDSTTRFDGSYASHMAFEAYSISNWRSFNHPQFNLGRRSDLWLKTEKRQLKIYQFPDISSVKELLFMEKAIEETKIMHRKGAFQEWKRKLKGRG